MTRTGARWYYGWNIVAAASWVTLLTVGLRMGIGPFFLPIAHDLGFSRSLLSTIVAVGMFCYGLGMPLAAHCAARYGTRFVLLGGMAIVATACVWTAFARTPLAFGLAFGVLLSTGLSFTGPVALTPVISRWFSRQRGMALFFLSTGSMAGIAVMTPVLTFAIEAVGWRATLVGFAGVFALFTLPIAFFVIRDQAPDHADWPPGHVAGGAAPAASAAPGLDFAGALRTEPLVGTHWELYLAASLGGLVWAGSIALSSAILADVYGVRLVGILYGWAYFGHQVGGTIGAWLGGWAYERFGTHWVAFGSAGVLLLAAAAISARLPVRGSTLPARPLAAGT